MRFLSVNIQSDLQKKKAAPEQQDPQRENIGAWRPSGISWCTKTEGVHIHIVAAVSDGDNFGIQLQHIEGTQVTHNRQILRVNPKDT